MVRTQKIDILNIVLILVSGLLAFFFPLQTFVLAFFVLGPLHYLTEISWLETKSYFSKAKNTWFWVSIVASVIILLPILYFGSSYTEGTIVYKIFEYIRYITSPLIVYCLLLAIINNVVTKGQLKRKLHIGLLILVGITSCFLGTSYYLMGVLIPTILHVYIFTMLFMFYGAKRNSSSLGYVSVIFALLMPLFYVYAPLEQNRFFFVEWMKNVFLENRFHVIIVTFGRILGSLDGTSFYFYENVELRLMMFLGFIYLYHYLNWFSKTTVIQWHKNMNKTRMIAILLIWCLISILLLTHFKIGFLMVSFFSFLHVFLEFPLNVESITGLFRKQSTRF